MIALEIKDKIQYGLGIAYNIFGEDSVLQEYVINAICSTLPADERDFSITSFEGTVPVSEIINAASMASFFQDSKRIVIVKNYTKEIKGADEEKLLSYVNDPNDDCTILFVNCGKAFKVIDDYCVPVDCNRATVKDLENFIRKIVDKAGYKMENKVMAEFIRMCNNDMGKITQEIKKLMAYTIEDKIIKLEDLKDIVCMNTENNVFDLTNAIQRGEKATALSLIDTMLKRGEKPSALLALITSSFRKTFWIANTNSTDEEMCKVLGMSYNAIKVNKSIIAKNKASRRGYIPYLKKTLDMLNELEYKFKSGIVSQESALRLAMAHLIG